MCDLPRLRGIKDSYKWLKEQDPETQLTPRGYRTIVESGLIPSVRRGKRYLIDINTLPEYIKRWVEAGANIPDQEIINITEECTPKASTERRRGNGKYGQIRSIG